MFGVVAETAKCLSWWHEYLAAGHCVGTFIDLHHLQREVRALKQNCLEKLEKNEHISSPSPARSKLGVFVAKEK